MRKHYKNYQNPLEQFTLPSLFDFLASYDNDFYETQCFARYSRRNPSNYDRYRVFSCKDIDGNTMYYETQKHILFGDIITPITRTAYTKSRGRSQPLSTIYETQSENIDVIETDAIAEQSTTTFTTSVSEACVPVDPYISNDISSNLGVNQITEISAYLAKPRRYNSYTWASTAVVNDTIFTIPDTWAIVSSVTPWIEKLKGYYGLKATLCVSLQLNATPYSAGRLRLAYYPGGDDNPRKASIHFTHAIPFSQLPGVEMEANDPNVCLRIPYITPLNFYEMTLNSTSWGRLDCHVVTPYRTGPDNAQSLQLAVWVWLEDVSLIGQTHSGIVTQCMDEYVTQAAQPSEKETKPFTSFFSNLAKAAASLKSIPVISAYAGIAEWAMQCASGIASVFGWSKPTGSYKLTRSEISGATNTANSTGDDACHSVAVLADAKLQALDDASLYKYDEMSIPFIKSRWSYLTNFTFATSNVAGDRLHLQHNQPRADWQVNLSATQKYLTPLAYLGHAFQMFRGGVQYKIKFAKTNFHRGQLQLTYQPGPSVDATLDTSTYMYREVINLSDCSEVHFTIPFLNPVEYLDTSISFGRWECHVVIPLQAPETVATTIDCSVYVRGAEDFEVLQPRNPLLVPYVTQSAEESELQNLNIKDLGYIGSSPQQRMVVSNALRCGSELVLSINSLLKRYSGVLIDTFGANERMDIFPYIFGALDVNNLFNVTPYQSYLVSPFAFYRGGIRLLTHTTYAGTDVAKAKTLFEAALNSTGSGVAVSSVALAMPDNTIAWTSADSVNGCLTIQYPFQCPNRMSPIEYQVNAANTTSFAAPRALVQMSAVPESKYKRAVADDFQLLFFVGIPRLADSPI